MDRTIQNRTLAFAALFQCIGEVDRLARSGETDPATLATMTNSILKLESASLEDIYGGVGALTPGLNLLLQELGESDQPRNLQAMRYAIALIDLQRRLEKNQAVSERLATGIKKAQAQSEYFEPTHENVIAGLASLYRDTISTLGPRLIVRGEQHHLANTNIADRIRAYLLAGIRAAVLWRQGGGNRWRLLLERRAMASEAQRLLT